jgi:hypothetical protein
MIDFTKPLRTKLSGRRLYVVAREGSTQARLDYRKDSHWKSGTLYGLDGLPVDYEAPQIEVENFEDDPFVEVVDVRERRRQRQEREAVERFNAQVQEELGDHALFGLF